MSSESLPSPQTAILVVDDDPDIGMALSDLLGVQGHQVEVVGTGHEALTRIKRHHFDTVLLDIGLPDTDGLAVLSAMVQLKPHLPIIILTAYTSLERSVGPLDSHGAFAYFTKPYNREVLTATIRKAVGQSVLVHRAERVQRALSGSETRFRSVIESVPDAIIQANRQGTIISWNQAAKSQFGYTEDEVMGKPLTMLMPPQYREAHQRGLERMGLTGEARVIGRSVELEGLRKDGSIFPIELSLGTWSDDTESFYCGIIRDITKRKCVEEELRHRIDLERLVATLSTNFIDLTLDDLNNGIVKALGVIGEFAGADRSYIFLFSEDGTTVTNTHEWCSENIAPQAHQLQDVANQSFPWILEQIRGNQIVNIPRVADLPPEANAERIEFQKQGIQSLLNVPLVCRGTVMGFLGFDSVRSEKVWAEDDFHLLKTVGEIVVNSLEQKQTDIRQRESEERFKRLVETANILPWEADYTTGQMTYIGPQANKLLGYPDVAWYRKHFWEDHIHPEDRQWAQTFCLESAVTKTEYELEYRMLAADGRIVWVHDHVRVNRDELGKPRTLQGFMFDITIRKQAEEMLQNAYREVGTILTNLPTLVFMIDKEGKVAYVNTLATQHFEKTERPLVGKLIHEILPFTVAQWNQLVTDFMLAKNQEELDQQEGEFQAQERTYRYRLFPVALPTSQLYETGLALWDISESQRLQDQLLQSEKLSSLGTMVSGMAHEISNPMQAVLGLTELILGESDPTVIKELASDLHRVGKHATTVLRDFVTYARTSSNAPKVPVDLNERLIEAVKMVQRGPHFGQVEVVTQLEPIPCISARQAEIDQIFINLIGNAVQAMQGKGRLTLATRCEEALMAVYIIDSGCGIPQEKLQKIFDPFFTTKPQGTGTGLGLSIVHKIMTKYGGTISVNSEEGKGTTFTIQFPIGNSSIFNSNR